MNNILTAFKETFKLADMLIAFMLVMVIALMIIPVSTFVLDILMTLNVAIGITVLLVLVGKVFF